MLKRTPLHDWHVAHGGRMVEFAGWSMPVQYAGIVEEHQAVRTAAGLFDISHMGRLALGGAGALDLVQEVFTNDAATMKDFQARYGLLCNEQGGVRDDVLVYRWPYGWAMVVNASNRAKVVDWLHEHRRGRAVDVVDQTELTAMIAVQGPRAVELGRGLTETNASGLKYYHAAPTRYQDRPCVVSRTGYTGEDGLEIMLGAAQAVELWEELVRRGARPCGLGARDTLRLEAAMPLYGHELTEETDPYQAGLGWAVKPAKGEFVGRAALDRRSRDPALPRRVGLELAGRRIGREGAPVLRGGQQVGRVTSGTFAPTLLRSIAMAYVEPGCVEPGTELEVDVRGKREAARVVPLPFYRRPRG